MTIPGWPWIHLLNYLLSHSMRTSIPNAILHASGRTKAEFSSAWGEAAIKEKLDEREKCFVANNPL